ncbi:MAG: CBS domain-containing protein [Chloroflexi bacterium]|nr:CBS domain-containing protein [Chloroflexota bacterium]
MWTHVITAESGSLASHAGIRMTVGKISGLPVVDSEKSLIGIVTEFDLVRALRADTDLAATSVDELMTRDVITVEADTPVDEVMAILERERILRVPVVSDGNLIGVVSRSDILEAALIGVYVGGGSQS